MEQEKQQEDTFLHQEDESENNFLRRDIGQGETLNKIEAFFREILP